MIKYYFIVVIAILVLCFIVVALKKWVLRSNSETDVSSNMIISGITLIVSAFPGTKEVIMSFVLKLVDKDMNYGTDYVAIVCGVVLIILGIAYGVTIRDRIFILNMFGIPVQKEISDEGNIKDLRLADFKVKESIIDFVDIFSTNMTDGTNNLIIKKIEKICTAFVNRSKDYKSCFTGMAPIPYTILAGNYLSSGRVRRYFEYCRNGSKYYELSKLNRKQYEHLEINNLCDIHENAKEIVVTLGVTRCVKNSDLVQFQNMDVIEIKLPEPKDNVIKSVKQLDEYSTFILDNIEALGTKYPELEKVHLVASIPSCLSIELGKKFALNAHRLTQIISYHYVNTQVPKYPFGIVVADGNAANRGRLIRG